MKVLQLYANWKWTGPAEPAVNLAATLRDRGHRVVFSCGRAVGGLENEIGAALAARDMAATGDFRLGKHRNPIFDSMDRRTMRKQIEELKPDILHCHLPNDHRIGWGAAKGLKSRPKVVRSLHDGEVPKVDSDFRQLMGPACDAVLCVSRTVARDLPGKANIPAEKVFFVEAAVDLERFEPRGGTSAQAKEYGLRKEDFVVGIVARMQRHRRFEIFFDAIAKVAEAVPELKVLMVGRGTWMDEVAVKPAARKELAGKVIFTGYRRGSEYVNTVRCMSAKIFLVPGSDGSCRAVREAMALGVPIVTTKRGMLPEIVEDGVSGIHIEEEVDSLADALIKLAREEGLRKRMSKAARDAAKERFGLPGQAERVESIYKWLLGKGERPPTGI